MPRVPFDLTSGSAVVELNPDENSSSTAFRALFVEVFDGPEPTLDSIDAVEALCATRADAPA